ncbi:hypothetical protein BDZ97DRAFT_1872214, partial [Flammula alnicola]
MLLKTTLSGTEQLLYFVTFVCLFFPPSPCPAHFRLEVLKSVRCCLGFEVHLAGCNPYHSSSRQLPSLLQEPSFSCYDGSLGPEGGYSVVFALVLFHFAKLLS